MTGADSESEWEVRMHGRWQENEGNLQFIGGWTRVR